MDPQQLGVLFAAVEKMFNDDDDDELLAAAAFLLQPTPTALAWMQEREQHFRLGHLAGDVNDWITRYLDEDFHDRFRMKKSTFRELVDVVRPLYPEKLQRGSAPLVECDTAVLITLTYLGRQTSMADIGDAFGVTASTVCNELHLVVKILCNLRARYIVWPTENECRIVEQQFRERAGFPGVIGAIDGCHVKVLAPAADQVAYTDRKMSHSIILQGICTATKIFTNVSIGTPGSRHDCRAMALSSVYQKIVNEGPKSVTYEDRYHLIGDKAYPNRCWLMAPFKDNGNLARNQKKYNFVHSQTRVVIEHTFGLLKGRWRRLLQLTLKDVAEDTNFILAACVLHNFCYLRNDLVINEMVDPEDRIRVERQVVPLNDNRSKEAGTRKREEIRDIVG